jgi:hypothetical protein
MRDVDQVTNAFSSLYPGFQIGRDFEKIENKGIEGFWRFLDVADGKSFADHVKVTQIGPDATAVKQILETLSDDTDGYAGSVLWDDTVDLVAQYREGYDLWSGTIFDLTIPAGPSVGVYKMWIEIFIQDVKGDMIMVTSNAVNLIITDEKCLI